MDGRPAMRGFALGIALAVSACTTATAPPAPSPIVPTTFRERVAALALKQVKFGAVSLLPVRFERSRIAGPFEDGERTLYCVSSRMYGRDFFEPERPKVVIREEIGTEKLSIVEEDDEVCSGHRYQPFPELDALGNRRGG
ncbi:hypothetical protein [Methylobacterium organophilum]|uniref:Lipoprotein n=1 Tax=Methylobacterium organophilum TaxID=410 RepID=A0ABQ4TE03_METOR|nr:hypothetical protein [Methylobacterium organophilum]GJE28267.1 hypothetical protein LKMONMHP_3134 [Methylobacterium organophilum]